MPIQEVVAALSDVIRAQQSPGAEHEPTATEFFALICSTLGASSEINDHTLQLLEILDGVTLQSAPLIVKSQFKTLSAGLLRILSSEPATEKWNRLLRLSLTVLGSLLQMQDTSEGIWANMEMLQCINAFLGFIDDARIKLRKTAQDQLLRLLSHHVRHKVNALRSYVSDFSLQVMAACTRSEYKRSLHVLLFLEKGAALLPESGLVRLFATMVRLLQCEQPVLTAAVFRTCDAFFQNPMYPLPWQQTYEVLNSCLLETRQQVDMESNVYRCTAVASGFACLFKQNRSQSFMLLPRCTSALIEGCETEFTQIHTAVSIALKRMMGMVLTDDAIDAAVAAVNAKLNNRNKSAGAKSGPSPQPEIVNILQFVSLIESLLLPRYQASWAYAMDAVKSLFDRVRGSGSDKAAVLLSSLLTRLAETFEATEQRRLILEPSVQMMLQETLGAALRSLGLANFLEIVPLIRSIETTPEYVGVDASREWILTILHANLRLMPCSLGDFESIILSVVNTCEDAVAHPEVYNITQGQVQLIRHRVLQLWSLFPGFCAYGPNDLADYFATIVHCLIATIKRQDSYPEVIPHVLTGLTHLASTQASRSAGPNATASPALAALRAQAHMVLPACLMFLEFLDVSDSRFQGGVQCVAAWASVSPPPLVSAVATKILELLLASTTASAGAVITPAASAAADAAAANWLAVMLAIIPHLGTEMVAILYKTVRPLLSVTESVSSQKRAYSVLESLLHMDLGRREALHQMTESRSDMLRVVSESLLNCHVSARHMRLRCMTALLRDMADSSTPQELATATSSILGEVLLCQKDANKKSRDCAVELLHLLIQRSEPQEMLLRLCSAVVGETSVMRSSAIVGMCRLFLDWRNEPTVLSSAAQLFPTLTLLVKEECAELSRAVLAYIRVCVAILPLELLGREDFLPLIVTSFSAQQLGPANLRSKFSSRVRGIMRKLLQRVGEDAVRALVSSEDAPLVEYIQRQARRSASKRVARQGGSSGDVEELLGSDSDNDDDDDDDEDEQDNVEARQDGKGRKNSNQQQKEDFRIAARPKAIRVADVRETLPTSLGDLLEGEGDDEDADYRVVVSATGQVTIQEKDATMAVEHSGRGGVGHKRGRDDDDGNDDNDDGGAAAAAAAAAAAKKQKSLHSGANAEKEPGSEYRSKKGAGGDVWKRGMLAPHAYLPLDARLLNKKNHKEAVAHFGAVVHSSSSGAPGSSSGGGRAGKGGKGQKKNRKQREAAAKKGGR